MKIVSNAMVEWQEMSGSSDDLKKLNSLLTSVFVGVRDVTSDACVDHAKVVLEFFISSASKWQHLSAEYLKKSFPESSMNECQSAIQRATGILWGQHWPDRFVVV